MSEWAWYRKSGLQEMRPYLPGEPLDGITVGAGIILTQGGMIARDTESLDRWYLPPKFFQTNYELVTPQPKPRSHTT